MPRSRLSALARRTRQLALGCLVTVSLIPASSSTALVAPRDYVGFETFAAWTALVPEVNRALFCGLTPVAHDMWAQGSLRMPADSFLRGDVTGTGREDWIVPLTNDREGKGCTHLLIVSRGQQGWQRLFFARIQKPKPGGSFGVLLSRKEHAVAVDLGDRERVTGPATLTWQNGKVIESRAGFVIEKTKIWEYARWNPSGNSYDYVYLATPEEWEIEQD